MAFNENGTLLATASEKVPVASPLLRSRQIHFHIYSLFLSLYVSLYYRAQSFVCLRFQRRRSHTVSGEAPIPLTCRVLPFLQTPLYSVCRVILVLYTYFALILQPGTSNFLHKTPSRLVLSLLHAGWSPPAPVVDLILLLAVIMHQRRASWDRIYRRWCRI